jgi:hypothetical protein
MCQAAAPFAAVSGKRSLRLFQVFVFFVGRVEPLSQELLGLLCELDVTAARFREELRELIVAAQLCVLHVLRTRLGALQRVVERGDQVVILVALSGVALDLARSFSVP